MSDNLPDPLNEPEADPTVEDLEDAGLSTEPSTEPVTDDEDAGGGPTDADLEAADASEADASPTEATERRETRPVPESCDHRDLPDRSEVSTVVYLDAHAGCLAEAASGPQKEALVIYSRLTEAGRRKVANLVERLAKHNIAPLVTEQSLGDVLSGNELAEFCQLGKYSLVHSQLLILCELLTPLLYEH